MKQRDRNLERTVIEFNREEIRARYALDNLRRFGSFAHFEDEDLSRLSDFFLNRIYPPVEIRETIDEAFEELHGLLRSPKRLTPLMTMALASAWRLGAQLPSALSAAHCTLDSYWKTRKLEESMVESARKRKLTAAAARKRDNMVRVLADVPEKRVRLLTRDLLQYFQSLTNLKMLNAMTAIMERAQVVMASRPEVYPESERRGVRLGLEMLQSGVALIEHLGERAFPAIIEGIEEVEHDWYDSILEEAGI